MLLTRRLPHQPFLSPQLMRYYGLWRSATEESGRAEITYLCSHVATDEIKALLSDIESDRVERTISTTNTDKFGQAIRVFANDLLDHRLPGYLFLGVRDDGEVKGVNVTDELLRILGLYKNALRKFV